jgi:hypothetical protein
MRKDAPSPSHSPHYVSPILMKPNPLACISVSQADFFQEEPVQKFYMYIVFPLIVTCPNLRFAALIVLSNLYAWTSWSLYSNINCSNTVFFLKVRDHS